MYLYISCAIVTFLVLLIINYINRNYFFLIEEMSNEKRKIHSVKVSRYGSLCFFSILTLSILISQSNTNHFYLYGFSILIIGLIEDLTNKFSSYFRLLLLTVITLFFLIYNDFFIISFNHQYLNFISESYFYSILFLTIGLLFLINGINFIDGLNGLALGTTMIILINFLILDFNNEVIRLLCLSLLIPTSILFLFNIIAGRIYLGDGGSYFLGGMLGIIAVTISNYDNVTAIQVACIIFYPITEVCFSFFRRLIYKKNPFSPDGKHLHTMLYKIVYKKIKLKNFSLSDNIVNSITSILILLCLICFTISLNIFIKNYTIELYLLITLFYLIIYFMLNKIYRNLELYN